jgi:hypothetical protein
MTKTIYGINDTHVKVGRANPDSRLVWIGVQGTFGDYKEVPIAPENIKDLIIALAELI